MSVIHDQLSGTLSRALSFRLQRANMIAANLSNLDTPGYTPVDIKFDEELRRHLAGAPSARLNTTNSRHVPLDSPLEHGEVEFDTYSLPDQRGNSVDLDHESSKLAENQLMYRTLITAYNKRVSFLQYVVREGS